MGLHTPYMRPGEAQGSFGVLLGLLGELQDLWSKGSGLRSGELAI